MIDWNRVAFCESPKIVENLQIRCLLANIPEPGWKVIQCDSDAISFEYPCDSPYGTLHLRYSDEGLIVADCANRAVAVSHKMIMFVLYLWTLLGAEQ